MTFARPIESLVCYASRSQGARTKSYTYTSMLKSAHPRRGCLQMPVSLSTMRASTHRRFRPCG
jgi:hypothetical protein